MEKTSKLKIKPVINRLFFVYICNMIYKQKKGSPYKLIKGVKKTVFNIRYYPGVYMIYVNKKVSYIGYSGTDVYKALYRHFQSWPDKNQVRITYNPDKVKVTVIYTDTSKQASDLETALIIKYAPDKNPQKYINYTTDKAEAKILEQFEEEDSQPIAQYTEDIPF